MDPRNPALADSLSDYQKLPNERFGGRGSTSSNKCGRDSVLVYVFLVDAHHSEGQDRQRRYFYL